MESTDKVRHCGFTLIELMIVITIIGILASIAVPLYRDYTIRARVAECASLFSPIKTEVSLRYSEIGGLPEKQSELEEPGRITLKDLKGDYVSFMTYGRPDVIKARVVCEVRNSADLGDARGKILSFVGELEGTQSINWTVSSPANNGIPEKYLPK